MMPVERPRTPDVQRVRPSVSEASGMRHMRTIIHFCEKRQSCSSRTPEVCGPLLIYHRSSEHLSLYSVFTLWLMTLNHFFCDCFPRKKGSCCRGDLGKG